ncbi:hypothetical protein C882_1390 [Caenispirillum salinarum AK4]|uniref:Uncharacterized protein n=1 Tax=Caenispirillum salinarum AK4 TaxID=1238182 RepID=K9GS12_9PROT|nr:hypothetical protein C882_1390 [Caenispirillum salinarum AK4]
MVSRTPFSFAGPVVRRGAPALAFVIRARRRRYGNTYHRRRSRRRPGSALRAPHGRLPERFEGARMLVIPSRGRSFGPGS